MAAIACEIAPHDRVRMPLPYALVTAAVAGFLPAGLGVPAWASLTIGVAVLVLVARFRPTAG